MMQADTPEGWYAEDTATLGDRIAAAREARGLKVEELARQLGVKNATVKSWEADASEPRANRLQMLAGMLGVSLAWLMAGQGDGVVAPDSSGAQPSQARAMLLDELRNLKGDIQGLTARIERLEQMLMTGEVA